MSRGLMSSPLELLAEASSVVEGPDKAPKAPSGVICAQLVPLLLLEGLFAYASWLTA